MWKGTTEKYFAVFHLPLEPVDSQLKSYVVKHTNERPSDPEESCSQQLKLIMVLEIQLPFLSGCD